MEARSPRSAIHGLPNQLAHAAGRCAQRIQLFGFEQRDTARRGGFENRSVTVEPPKHPLHFGPERPGHGDGLAQRFLREHRVEQAIPAVGYGALEHYGVWKCPAHADGQCFRHLLGAK